MCYVPGPYQILLIEIYATPKYSREAIDYRLYGVEIGGYI